MRGITYDSEFKDKLNQVAQYLIKKTLPLNINPVPIRNNLVRLTILDPVIKIELLTAARNLKSSEFSNIYIFKDLTFKQREELRRKRERSRMYSNPVHSVQSTQPIADHSSDVNSTTIANARNTVSYKLPSGNGRGSLFRTPPRPNPSPTH